MTLRPVLVVVLLAGALVGCRGSGCAEQGGNPCFDPDQNRPAVPGGAAVALEAQARASGDCFQGWGELADGEPLREGVAAQVAEGLDVASVDAGRVRVFVGPDVDGGAARTVTRFVVEVTAPAAVAGDWVLQLPGVSATAAPDGTAAGLERLSEVELPAVLRGCVTGL